MSQKLLQGGVEPHSRSAAIREIYEHQFNGQATIAMLVDACIVAGVFSTSTEEAIIALAKSECKKVLKEQDAQGLNYAAPVRKTEEGTPLWIQRPLWSGEDYVANDDELFNKREQIDEKRLKYRDEATARFGKIKWRH